MAGISKCLATEYRKTVQSVKATRCSHIRRAKARPNPAVASVVVLTVVTGMQLANDPMETAFHQAVQSLAHGVCLAHGPTQKERVPRLGVGSERKIGGCRVGQPDHPPDRCYFGEVLGKAIGISRKNCIA